MLERRHPSRWLLVAAVFGVILLVVGGYWAWKREPQAPPTTTTTTTLRPPAYPADAPALNRAREALRKDIDPAEAVALARELPDSPELPDAQFLLLEYAAEKGNPEAALAVGCFYDPAYKGPSGTIRKNAATAYEWYQVALAAGLDEARKRLAELRRWVEQEAAQGSGEAKELLKSWR